MSYRPSKIVVLREAVIKVTQILTDKKVQVIQRGMKAAVEYDKVTRLPKIIYLPMLPDDAADELCDAIQGFLDHEVAHVLFSDVQVLDKAEKLGEQGRSIANMVEDTYIERKMASMFRGSGSNLQQTGVFYLEKYVKPKLKEAQKAGDMKAEISVLFPSVLRAMAGQFNFKEALKEIDSPLANEIYSKLEDLSGQLQAAETSADAFKVTQEILKRFEGGKSEGDNEGDESQDGQKSEEPDKDGKNGDKQEKKELKGQSGEDQSDAEDGAKGEGEKQEGEGSEADDDQSDGDKSDDGEGERESKDSDEDGDDKGDAKNGKSSDSDSQPGKSSDEIVDAPEKNSTKEHKAPEGNSAGVKGKSKGKLSWDEISKAAACAKDFDGAASELLENIAAKSFGPRDYLAFTTDKDEIKTLKVPSSERDWGLKQCLDNIEEPVSAMVNPMQKELERAISARSASVYVGGYRSGRLHGSSLARLHFKDDRVFRRKTENETKNVAVELVVDISGSMGGQKILKATQSAFALSSVLERLKIKHEVICFTTGEDQMTSAERRDADTKNIKYARTENLVMPIIKNFDESLNADVRSRFGYLPYRVSMRSNIDGESIEVAARRLMQRQAARHVMIVLSDGEPAGHSYGFDMGVKPLRNDLKHRVERLSKYIDVVGIGIMSNAVAAYYPKHVVLNKVEELPGTVIKQLRSLLIPK